MKKLITKMLALTAIVLFCVGNVFSADYSAPATKTYGSIVFLDVENTDSNASDSKNNSYLTYGSYYVAKTLAINTWYNSSDGSPGSNLNAAAGISITDQVASGFIAGSSVTTENGYGSIKAHSTRIRYFYVTGCTSVAIISADNSASKYITLSVESVDEIGALTAVGTAATATTKGTTASIISFATELNPTLYYKVSVGSNNSSNSTFHQICFRQPASCTAASFSFPENSDIEINNGGILTAPALTNTNALIDVTYASSNTNVVTVDATTGALTEVGVGEATITASAARQDVGDVTYCAAEASYTVTIKSTSPTLECSETAVNLVLGKFATTKTTTFTISGYNLGTATSAAICALPVGFELTPNACAISEGAVDQEFQLTYSAEAAAEATDFDLTFTVSDEISVTISVAYGKEVQAEWATVSGITTWDFSGQIAKETTLSETTQPAQGQVIVLADFPDITPKEDFDAAALKVRGQRLSTTYWQGDSLTFKVDKAGTIDVTFSNTGDRKTDETLRRYLNVQGIPYKNADTKNGSINATAVTVSNIPVVAGEVTLYGTFSSDSWIAPQYLRYYKIVYTPTAGPSTGICNTPSINNISFNGQTIFNPENIALEVYDTTGRMVIRSNENVDMSGLKGVFVIKAQQETLKIAVTK